MSRNKVNIQLADGSQQEVPITIEDYKAADDRGLTLSQFYNQKFQTAENQGTAFQQMLMATGLLLSNNRDFGYRPPTLKAIFDGTASLQGTAITRPDGSQSDTPAGRLLYPAVITDILSDVLYENKSAYNSAFLDMIAITRSIPTPRYDVITIDSSLPRGARAQPIGQLAEPSRMLSVKTSSIQRSLPTYSIGMEISDQALEAATLDLIGLAFSAHTVEDRSALYMSDLSSLVFGSVDTGDVALAAVTATSFDSTLANVVGAFSQKAWVKFLRQNWRKRSITDAIMDIDTYLSLEGRSGRITTLTATATDERLNPIPHVVLPGVGAVNVFITDGVQGINNSVLGANTILGLDRSKALRRIVYTGANYHAVEEWVMRRSRAIRVDYSERIEQAGYTEAFQLMTLT